MELVKKRALAEQQQSLKPSITLPTDQDSSTMNKVRNKAIREDKLELAMKLIDSGCSVNLRDDVSIVFRGTFELIMT